MAPFIHPQAICESNTIGDNTRIWAFAHVLPKARVGQNCNICDGVFIENDVIIGDDVTIKCGVQVWDGIRIANNVFIGPNATFTNDPFPRSKQHLDKYPPIILESGCSIGANATILPGVRIGMNAMVGAGAVVTGNVAANSIVMGNPARVSGYVDAKVMTFADGHRLEDCNNRLVPAAHLIALDSKVDERGRLSVLDRGALPFVPQRFFMVDQVGNGAARGGRAHRTCHQLLVVIGGAVTFAIDDGHNRAVIELKTPSVALHLRPLVWAMQFNHSENVTLMVMTSEAYDPADYISDYESFLTATKR